MTPDPKPALARWRRGAAVAVVALLLVAGAAALLPAALPLVLIGLGIWGLIRLWRWSELWARYGGDSAARDKDRWRNR